MEQFTYLDSNILSTESEVIICQVKVWTAIDRLSILWTSDLSDKRRHISNMLLYPYYYMDAPHGRKQDA